MRPEGYLSRIVLKQIELFRSVERYFPRMSALERTLWFVLFDLSRLARVETPVLHGFYRDLSDWLVSCLPTGTNALLGSEPA